MDLTRLKQLPLLATLPDTALEGLRASARLARFRAGQLLHSEGEACTALELIVEGRLAVERITREGDLMRIAEFGPGGSIGGNLLFSSDPVHHLAITATQPTTLLRIDKRSLLALLGQHQRFLLAYLGEVADRALVLEGTLTRYANLPLRARIRNYLRAQQRAQGTPVIRLPGSKKALAAQLGVQRSSLSRALQQMKQEGQVDFDRHSITLLK